MLKVKIFYGGDLPSDSKGTKGMEESINAWLVKNERIEVLHMKQSYNPGNSELVITILYRDGGN